MTACRSQRTSIYQAGAEIVSTIMELMTSWEQKGRALGMEQGEKEGVLRVTQRLLRLRVGSLPSHTEERLRPLPIKKLELLSEASFSFTALADVESWLSTHP